MGSNSETTDTVPESKAHALVSKLNQSFHAGITRNVEWRKQQLTQLLKLVVETQTQILDALHKDLRQTPFLGELAEINGVKKEVEFALENLYKWTQPEKRSLDPLMQPGSASVLREPYGTVLVIAPWNYPISLMLKPLVGAIAAGNCVVLKPSEVSSSCSAFCSTFIPKYLDTRCIAVVEGGIAETTDLLRQKWDYIFYTGSSNVGKIVMQAAAVHLTPVTLELGGKSPCIVDKEVDLEAAVRRICWGKFTNAGQTCVAPDYILVHKDIQNQFLEKVKATVVEFYGDNPQKSPDYSRVINKHHTLRLQKLLLGGTPYFGGVVDVDDHYVSPTVLLNPDLSSPLMKEEIFGPLLPVIPYNTLDEVVEFVNRRDKPLALYIFSRDQANIDKVLLNTSSGGAAVNDTVFQVACQDLPFGGVGPSGMGSYNGHRTFLTFSHEKGVLNKATWADPDIRYPPYTESKIKMFKFLSNLKLPSLGYSFKLALLIALSALVAKYALRH